MKTSLQILSCLLILSACSHNGQKQEVTGAAVAKREAQLETNRVDQIKQGAGLTDAARHAIATDPAPTQHSKVAGEMLDRALIDFQEAEVMPPGSEILFLRSMVDRLVSTNMAMVVEGRKQMEVLDAKRAEDERIKAGLQAELAREKGEHAKTTERLVEMGKKYEEEKNRSIVKRAWRWAIGTFGIAGLIALAIFFPPFIPILCSLAGKVLSWFPSLVKFVKVVSVQAYDAVVDGVGKFRGTLKAKVAADPEATMKVKDVLELVNSQMDKTTRMDAADYQKLIESRRAVLRV